MWGILDTTGSPLGFFRDGYLGADFSRRRTGTESESGSRVQTLAVEILRLDRDIMQFNMIPVSHAANLYPHQPSFERGIPPTDKPKS